MKANAFLKILSNGVKAFVAILVALLMAGMLAISTALPAKSFASNSEEKSAEIAQLIAAVDTTQTEINNADKRIKEAQEQLIDAQDKKEDAQEAYDIARENIEAIKPQLQETTQNSYATYLALDLLDSLVGNPVISNAIFNETIVKFLTGHDDQVVEQIVELYLAEEDAYNQIVNQEKIAKEMIENSEQAQKDLNNAYAQLMQQLNIAQEDLAAIKDYEAEYGIAGASRIVGSGQFAHPCPDGSMSSPFGEFRESDTGGYVHKGVDFSAPSGTPIYAADDGTVIEATYTDDYNGGRGMWIVVSHGNGLVTQYMHCSHIYVPIGARIHKGDNIAEVGSTGDSTGPHLHFQVELNGNPVNGMDYLSD